ncbi:MAG: arginine--tRNA ligase [Bacteroidota bacterium]
MKKYLNEKLEAALKLLGYFGSAALTFEHPKNPEHGDFTTNIAMMISKQLKKNPRQVASEIINALNVDSSFVDKIDIAGPGFLNFHFTPKFFSYRLHEILKAGGEYGRVRLGEGKKTQVEFVSANPTGLLHLGHGRQAAIGDTISNILTWAGYRVTREYYFNNAGRQMRMLADSVYARYMQIFDESFPMPEDGYMGGYIKEIAQKIFNEKKDSLKGVEDKTYFKEYAEAFLFKKIKETLNKIGVKFDVFFNEDSLYSSGAINEVIEEFRKKGLAYDLDGAVWFKTTALGLDQDRVIVKSTGEPTYRLPDIAYHRNKFMRGFELIVDIFGSDHVATVPDVLAGIKALGYDQSKVRVLIHQFVTLTRGGEQVKMSKRTADVVTLDDLIEEVGKDVVRYFLVMRSVSSHLEFDLELAKEQSDKNPVYYLQYAHARIASILRFAESEGADVTGSPDLSLLQHESEVSLMKMLIDFPNVILLCAVMLEPHHLCDYLHDVATEFHQFYHHCRVVTENKEVSKARLALSLATKTVLANGLGILGITAPEKM